MLYTIIVSVPVYTSAVFNTGYYVVVVGYTVCRVGYAVCRVGYAVSKKLGHAILPTLVYP